MFEVDLRTQVTPSGPDNPDWGGPACCQMAMSGYPPGATSCYIDQATIWNYIQANNKEGGLGPWGIGWYSDPFAITKTLNDLCPPQHHWIDISGTDKNGVLYTLFRWMANYRYASLVCVYEHDYWSTLVYYRTSDDTGEFEELCAFSRPVRYLSEDEARAIAGSALGLGRRELSRMELELVYRPLRAHVSTAQPAWYASIDERAVHVSQLGEIFGTLQYPTYRGA